MNVPVGSDLFVLWARYSGSIFLLSHTSPSLYLFYLIEDLDYWWGYCAFECRLLTHQRDILVV